jgi:hypothetical protein
LVAIDLASVSETQLLMSETVFTFLFMLSLWLVVRCIKGRAGTESLIGAGLGLAVATHVRPAGYCLPLLLAAAIVVFAWAGRRRSGGQLLGWGKLALRAGALLVLPVLVLGGWQALRLARTGHASFSNMDGVNMLFYRGAGVRSLVEGRSLVEVQKELGLARDGGAPFAGYFRQHPEAESLNAAGVSNRWVKEGLAILARHPLSAILLSLRGVVQVLLDPGVWELGRVVPVGAYGTRWEMAETVQKRPLELLRTFWQSDPVTILLMLTGIFWQILLVAGMLIWLVWRPGDRSGLAWLLFVLILYFLPFAAGPEGSSRFRVPFEPLLALLAVAGWGRKFPGHSP